MDRQLERHWWRTVGLVWVLALVAAACGSASTDESAPIVGARSDGPGVGRWPPATPPAAWTPATDDRPSEPCDPADIGDDWGEVTAVYRVSNGQLDGICFGQADRVAEDGWDTLASVAPPEQLDAVVLYGAYQGDADTLAFAGPLGDDNDDFVIAVDVVAGAEDPDELQLTMVHEFAHVITQTPDQLDLSVPLSACGTYWNGFGCFTEASFMAAWIAEFWPPETLETLPLKGGIDEDGGYDRCTVDPQYLGSYAASHPEEDFAESFSAYVFDLDVPSGVEPRMAFFDRWPELVAFADRAAAADLTGIEGNFDRCG